MKFIDLLLEAKQVGTLYHFTTFDNFQSIVKKDFKFFSQYSHKDYPDPVISFTRDATGSPFKTGMRIVRFSFDGDKMSNNYKLVPLADYKRGYGRKSHQSQSDESETALISKSSKPGYGSYVDLKPYITRIDIISLEFYDFFKDPDNRYQSSPELDKYKDLLSSIDLPVYIHDKTDDSTHEYPIKQKYASKFKKYK